MGRRRRSSRKGQQVFYTYIYACIYINLGRSLNLSTGNTMFPFPRRPFYFVFIFSHSRSFPDKFRRRQPTRSFSLCSIVLAIPPVVDRNIIYIIYIMYLILHTMDAVQANHRIINDIYVVYVQHRFRDLSRVKFFW